MFDSLDKTHLKTLTQMLINNVEISKLKASDISRLYHAFEWLQGLEEKFDKVQRLQNNLHDLSSSVEERENSLLTQIEVLEEEIKELKKPKRRRTTKKK